MAVFWAAMQLPEMTMANQSLRKTGFRKASQVEAFREAVFMGGNSLSIVQPNGGTGPSLKPLYLMPDPRVRKRSKVIYIDQYHA
jgi:hypothetical protein